MEVEDLGLCRLMRVIQALVSIVVIAPIVMIIILQGFFIVGVTGMPVSACPCIQSLHHTIGSLKFSRLDRNKTRGHTWKGQ